MLGVLLESRARRQRRSGGMALSVAAHLAIISGGIAATAVTKSPPPKKEPVIVLVAPGPKPPEPTPVRRVARATGSTTKSTLPNIVIKHIDAPNLVPMGIPEITMVGSITADSIVIGGGSGTTRGIAGSLIGGDAGGASSNEWRGNDAFMNLVKSATPRYPEVLRQSGVDGRVLIRFTVDTLGRIDQSSVQILSETHPLFSRAVREALSGFRFRAAESNGKKVPALAEMPFEFSLKNR